VIRPLSTTGRLVLAAILALGIGAPAFAGQGNDRDRSKLDAILMARAGTPGLSRVIVRQKPGTDASSEVMRLGGRVGRKLALIDGQAVEIANSALLALAARSEVVSLHDDRAVAGELNRVAVTSGARAVQQQYGYTGAGVGVAVIDSGITDWHDDLSSGVSSLGLPTGQRVSAFVDFVNNKRTRYDDNGHGTHVAGIIIGNGFDSSGGRSAIAPGSHIVSLKVLDQNGNGVISNVIAALEWIVAHRAEHTLRVINLSVGAAITESYETDPLTIAAKRAVDAGLVVVTAAGNRGKNPAGTVQYGGITAPGNAPWVLTVGAYSHEGTVSRTDDVMAGFSSRGPTAIDYLSKPDVVAPGVGTQSLAAPLSLFYSTKSDQLLWGSILTPYKPYLSLSGTSMSAPVVSGTAALMIQANPSLTPNLVKGIIQYTAQRYPAYNPLTQGAGFLNAQGAVTLARFFRYAQPGSTLMIPSVWSKQILWGNHRIKGGAIRPNANAFTLGTTWGSAVDYEGDNIVWGTLLESDNIVWGTFDQLGEDNIVWGTLFDTDGDNIVWGTNGDADNIVWGTVAGDENIVWGTVCGGDDCDNIVWGTAILGFQDDVAWGSNWGGDNIVWGTATELFADPLGEPVTLDQSTWESLFVIAPAGSTSSTATAPGGVR
jgi:serine protease AprX